MTTYYPISGAPYQFFTSAGALASGYVLKAYSAGTSTPISMATDYTGGTTASTITLNASGYPAVSGNVVIPHIAEDYKLALYATQAAADANSGAIWNPDNNRVSQIANAERLINYAADAGVADVYSMTPDPAISAYAVGQIVTLKAANANTGSCTIAVSGLAAKSIKLLSGSNPYASAIVSGGTYFLMYDGTNFVLCNPSPQYSYQPAALTTNTFSGAQIGGVTALTSTSNSIAINLALNNNFSHTFTENTTLANPTNIVAGQSGRIFFTQHASSPKTLAFGTYYLFPAVENGGSDPAVTATNSAVDVLYYDVLSTTQISCHLAKGLA